MNNPWRLLQAAAVFAAVLAGVSVWLVTDAAGRAQVAPPPLVVRVSPSTQIINKVRLDQRMNAQVPLNLAFRDDNGRPVTLGQFFGSKPVMMNLIQYRCRMLCSQEMNVLVHSLRQLRFDAGNQFTLLTVSIDPTETPALAAAKKKTYLARYGRPGTAAGWHFLTGDQASIQALANAIGYHYTYDARTDQFAHPDGIEILTPHGKVARYFMRLEYPSEGLRLGLVEAAKGKIGTPLDTLALLCYHYDPLTGTYSLAFMKLLRLAGIATMLAIGAGILLMKRRERSARRLIRTVDHPA